LSVHERENLFEFKEVKSYKRMNTLNYFDDYNFRLTPKSDKLAISEWAVSQYQIFSKAVCLKKRLISAWPDLL